MDIQSVFEWGGSHGEFLGAIFTALAAGVALVSMLLSRHETHRQRLLQRESLRQRIDGASLDWGCTVIDTLSEASALALSHHLTEAEMQSRRLDVARRLSALIDQGRMFFPNVDPDGHGTDKEQAYKGKRPAILDAVMYAYYEVMEIGQGPVRGEDSAGFITECRRLAVSELQAHLDPHRLDEVIERYTDQRPRARADALNRAGRLGIILDARRPGLLTRAHDRGWMDLVPAEERRRLLHDVQEREAPAP